MQQLPNVTPFKPKSTFLPPITNASILTFCRLVEQEVLNFVDSKPFYFSDNLTREERVALQQLADDKQLVIKPAEKGGAIVLQTLSDYKAKAYRQLDDCHFYRKLDFYPTAFQTKVSTI